MTDNNVSFESSLEELEGIVNKLENGNCTLDESIMLFENGIKLSKQCKEKLDDANQKIITLTQAENEGITDD